MASHKFCPLTFAEEIDKAVRFIKVRQFHAGFTEINQPHLGGAIEVTIEPEEGDENVFHIMFKFIAIPSDQIIIQELKTITYHELRMLAAQYDLEKDDIDNELASRAA